jgi:hypothetical protein
VAECAAEEGSEPRTPEPDLASEACRLALIHSPFPAVGTGSFNSGIVVVSGSTISLSNVRVAGASSGLSHSCRQHLAVDVKYEKEF